MWLWSFPGGSVEKNPSAKAGEAGLIPGWGRSPAEGNNYSLQYSCLENSMDRRAWWATVHGVAKSHMTKHRHSLKLCDMQLPCTHLPHLCPPATLSMLPPGHPFSSLVCQASSTMGLVHSCSLSWNILFCHLYPAFLGFSE